MPARFNVPRPCAECPFSKGQKAVRVTPDRARELIRNMLSPAGASFHCHKTVDYSGDEPAIAATSLHCAGALIFAEKSSNATQVMRIAERLGLYDAQKLMADAEAQQTVFDTEHEMIEACQQPGYLRTR